MRERGLKWANVRWQQTAKTRKRIYVLNACINLFLAFSTHAHVLTNTTANSSLNFFFLFVFITLALVFQSVKCLVKCSILKYKRLLGASNFGLRECKREKLHYIQRWRKCICCRCYLWAHRKSIVFSFFFSLVVQSLLLLPRNVFYSHFFCLIFYWRRRRMISNESSSSMSRYHKFNSMFADVDNGQNGLFLLNRSLHSFLLFFLLLQIHKMKNEFYLRTYKWTKSKCVTNRSKEQVSRVFAWKIFSFTKWSIETKFII